ncbi:helix-turn-helix domain-containing protein [Actinophytocola oryzae]|uniref:helix-turn-helix domain-containing protein n=1 Tax=Actinophytocola oryzae TaxID=502181 RepID=UPI001FBAB079|nr:helix-turn-helix transcriptional regulator [Actinophytocola oryzae]
MLDADVVAAQVAVRAGDGSVPRELLFRALGGGTRCHPAPRPHLTPRQTAVLSLMADGLGNADIAAGLSCSEHTVKNVIYETMSRLQARNRAHAVASAVRCGLI